MQKAGPLLCSIVYNFPDVGLCLGALLSLFVYFGPFLGLYRFLLLIFALVRKLDPGAAP